MIADSVRRPDERRKRQRDSKATRKAAEKEAREAEIRRLKNLKKQEIQDMYVRGVVFFVGPTCLQAAATGQGRDCVTWHACRAGTPIHLVLGVLVLQSVSSWEQPCRVPLLRAVCGRCPCSLHCSVPHHHCRVVPAASHTLVARRFTRIQQEAGIKTSAQAAEADDDMGDDGDDAAAAAVLSKSGGLANLLDELLEGDFDPEAYDKRMAAAFDDEYYQVCCVLVLVAVCWCWEQGWCWEKRAWGLFG